MKICVFGAGAIGGYIAGHLARVPGVEVSAVARGAHLRAIQERGLRNVSPEGDFTVALSATDNPAELGVQDYLFITLKSHQVTPALDAMRPLIGPDTAVIPPTTGIPYWYFHDLKGPFAGRRLDRLDPGGRQWDVLGPERAIGCVYWVGTELPEPGVVRMDGGIAGLPLGEPDGSVSPRLQSLARAMKEGGLSAPMRDNIRGEVWIKMINSMCWNPVAALSMATLGEICDRPELIQLVRRMMGEAEAVATALGVTIPVAMEKRITGTATIRGHKMSMLQDLERGRPLEIDVLADSIAEMGTLAGIATPTIDAMLAMVRLRAAPSAHAH
ncbi:MAG: 2-dehydropantoate 2-reductase [Alphaproteobacteria bacterium]|nr:2-dehydropantoate 2-reductase [Alphaproteobacteria bacterium]